MNEWLYVNVAVNMNVFNYLQM